MLDIHKYDEKLKIERTKIETLAVSPENKECVLKFEQFLHATGASKPRIIKYLCYLRILALFFSKDFLTITKTDIENCIAHINQQPYSPWTVQAYKVIVKRFFQWLYNFQNKKYPELVDWISISIPKSKLPRRTPHEFPTADDVAKLVQSARTLRDKALIACIGESGCRIGEIGNLAIRHVSFDTDGAVLYVHGKTGFRPVRVVYASYYLQKWFNAHPLKDNPDAPMWVNSAAKQLTHQRLYEIIKRLGKRVGLSKKVNLHNFRHGRGTFLAHFLNGYQLCNYMGWTPGSKMASVYIHMSGHDTDAAILQLHGLQTKNNLQDNNLRAQRCPNCQQLIPITETCNCQSPHHYFTRK